ncbi:MAG: NAD(P)/FAD-dependent oxidoreductase [Acidobacteria bacterium]|nr:NAD(P)/FAD-dependent oxidoreductase [Acidobacteriota bacterium]
MYDVIVVGARCAGSPTARLLARKGHRVLLLDKAHFPSDTLSSHLIWHSGLARAKRWGLLDRITGLGAPPIRRVTLDADGVPLGGTPPPIDGIDFAVAPRRTVLDKMLLDAAAESGVEVREGFQVGEIARDGGRVVGVRGHAAAGRDHEERARIVVGADGVRSIVASAVNAPRYNERPSASNGYYSYWRGGPRITGFEIWVRPGWAVAGIPTNDGATLVIGGWTPAFQVGNPEQGYRKMMENVPVFSEFLDRGEQVERLFGVRELPGYFRRPWGDGWALAGDAGYHKHPLSAQGISDAFRDADLLSAAIHDGLTGNRPLDAALAEYERRRNEAVLPMYESTCARALLQPFGDEQKALFRALAANQHEADRFFGTDAGTVPIPEFFAPQNLQRIVRSAHLHANSAESEG